MAWQTGQQLKCTTFIENMAVLHHHHHHKFITGAKRTMFYGLMLETSTKELYGWYILIILVIYMCMKSVTLLVYLFTKGLVGSLGHNVNASDDLRDFVKVKCATVTQEYKSSEERNVKKKIARGTTDPCHQEHKNLNYLLS